MRALCLFLLPRLRAPANLRRSLSKVLFVVLVVLSAAMTFCMCVSDIESARGRGVTR